MKVSLLAVVFRGQLKKPHNFASDGRIKYSKDFPRNHVVPGLFFKNCSGGKVHFLEKPIFLTSQEYRKMVQMAVFKERQ